MGHWRGGVNGLVVVFAANAANATGPLQQKPWETPPSGIAWFETAVIQAAAKKKPKPAPAQAPATKPAIDPFAMAFFEAQLVKAEAGDQQAMEHVAFSYAFGNGAARDADASATWTLKREAALIGAANAGDSDAMADLVTIYESGLRATIVPDPVKARYWMERRRAAAYAKAHTGDAAAMLELADFLEQPSSGEADYSAAIAWFHKAAEAGSYEAMTRLAQKYDDGIDVPADRSVAARWYLKASANPKEAWGARIALAQKYKTGDGIAKDMREAARLHVLIAEGYGGWRRRMKADSFARDVQRSERAYRVSVQKELFARGLYIGLTDGEMTDALTAAITKLWRSKVKDD
jgi:TPR repeat protein